MSCAEGVIMRKFFRDNGLSIALLFCFGIFMVGQIVAGDLEYNEEQIHHGNDPIPLTAYLHSGHFLEATAEN